MSSKNHRLCLQELQKKPTQRHVHDPPEHSHRGRGHCTLRKAPKIHQ